VTSDTTKVHPIHIQLYRLLTERIRISLRFGVRRVETLACLAFEVLASELRFASFDLFFGIVTLWTFAHFLSLHYLLSFPHSSFF
jgi:hypothetical protein